MAENRPEADADARTDIFQFSGSPERMLDKHTAEIEALRDEGAVILIKWDGLRTLLRQTLVVTRPDTDYVWRKDCDDIDKALQEAIEDYRKAHPN